MELRGHVILFHRHSPLQDDTFYYIIYTIRLKYYIFRIKKTANDLKK